MTRPDAARFEQLLDEAAGRPMVGWDFTWLGDRMTGSSPDSTYEAWVDAAIDQSPDLLDMGTGGGEWLAARLRIPARTVATEGWTPNVPIARARLAPLGVEVVAASGGPDNVRQTIGEPAPRPGMDGALPFPDASFGLVINRHEWFIAAEVCRILSDDGNFITRQVGDGTAAAIQRVLGLPTRPAALPEWTSSLARQQLEAVGFQVVATAHAIETATFRDAAAFGWYVASVPW